MLKPIDDKVVIKPIKKDEVTSSGFIVTNNTEKPQEAEVIAIGTGVTTKNGVHIPIPLKVGQKVIFSKYGGNEVTHDGESYTIISYNDIFAVLDED